MKMTQDEKYMKAAIREAKKAYALDEVPIGCVIVQDGTIIARGYNRRKYIGTCRTGCDQKSEQKDGGLAVGGLHDVCDAGAVPDVRRSDRAEPHEKSCHCHDEPEGGMRRFGIESFTDGGIQPSGGD